MASKIKFKIGQKIYHKFYGKGKVKYIGRNEQDELYYEVAFPRYGKVVTVMNEKDMVPYSDADEKIVNGLIANMIGSEYHGVKPMDEWSGKELDQAHERLIEMAKAEPQRPSDEEIKKDIEDAIKEALESAPNNKDAVNHPSHYNTGSIEVIDFIEDKKLNFNLGNAVKYLCRCEVKYDGKKRIEDLNKAIWYIKRQISIWEKQLS